MGTVIRVCMARWDQGHSAMAEKSRIKNIANWHEIIRADLPKTYALKKGEICIINNISTHKILLTIYRHSSFSKCKGTLFL